jgi:hypothetical protein
MIITIANGRLGNQIFRNLAVSIIAKKHDLLVNYISYDIIKQLGINLYIGRKKYAYYKNMILSDTNYFDILNKGPNGLNLNPNHNYFQTQKISKILFIICIKYLIIQYHI